MQNGGLVGDVAVGVGGVTLKLDAFTRLNDNGLLIGRDFDCTGEKGYKLCGTSQMWLRFPMAAGSQLHIADGELPVFIVRKKAVVLYLAAVLQDRLHLRCAHHFIGRLGGNGQCVEGNLHAVGDLLQGGKRRAISAIAEM